MSDIFSLHYLAHHLLLKTVTKYRVSFSGPGLAICEYGGVEPIQHAVKAVGDRLKHLFLRGLLIEDLVVS